MRNRAEYLERLVVALVLSLVVFSAPVVYRATCGDEYNNQGPYVYSQFCYDNPDCDNYGEDLACQEQNCENCLLQKTGYSTFCVESYDCFTIPGCYGTICT